jgi:hypothetical protein
LRREEGPPRGGKWERGGRGPRGRTPSGRRRRRSRGPRGRRGAKGSWTAAARPQPCGRRPRRRPLCGGCWRGRPAARTRHRPRGWTGTKTVSAADAGGRCRVEQQARQAHGWGGEPRPGSWWAGAASAGSWRYGGLESQDEIIQFQIVKQGRCAVCGETNSAGPWICWTPERRVPSQSAIMCLVIWYVTASCSSF